MRYPVASFGLLLVGFLLALLSAPYFLSVNDYRTRLETYIAENSDYRLVVRGETHLTLRPLPELRLMDVSLIRAKNGAQHLPERIDMAALRLRLAAAILWSGGVRLRSIDAQAMKLDMALSPSLVEQFTRPQSALPPISWSRARITIQGDFAAPKLTFTDARGALNVMASGETSIALAAVLNGEPIASAFKMRARDAALSPIDFFIELGEATRLTFSGRFSRQLASRLTGEFTLRAPHLMQALLPRAGLVWRSGRVPSSKMAALVDLTETGLRLSNLQIEALRTGGTGSMFFSRRAPAENQPAGFDFVGRLTIANIDFNTVALVARAPAIPPAPVPILELIETLFGAAAGDLTLGITRLHFADELVRNLELNAGFAGDKIAINGLRANLPFNGGVLVRGVARLKDPPRFAGEMALRSSQAPYLMAWLARGFGKKLPLDDIKLARLQRIAFGGALAWTADNLRLSGWRGRVNNAPYRFNLALERAAKIVIDTRIEVERLDLDDWGLLASASEDAQASTGVETLPIAHWIERLTGGEKIYDNLRLRLYGNDVYAGATRLGPMRLELENTATQLHIKSFELSNYLDTQVTGAARLSHDGRNVTGHADMRVNSENAGLFLQPFARFTTPFKPVFPAEIDAAARIDFSQSGDAIWPAAKLQITGDLGQMKLSALMVSATRDFEPLSPGTDMQVEMGGAAASLRQFIGSGAVARDDKTQGKLLVSLQSKARDKSEFAAMLDLGGEQLQIDGTLGGSQAGVEIEGLATFHFDPHGFGLPRFAGDAKINWNSAAFTFSTLRGTLGTGDAAAKVTGEGVLSLTAPRPRLTSNLLVQDFDLTPLMPTYQNGWTATPFDWSLLGEGDASLDLRFVDLRLGGLPKAELNTRLRLVDGILESERFELGWLGGRVQLSVQASGGALLPSLNVAGSFTDISAAPLLQAVYQRPILSAALRGELELLLRGPSLREMMNEASGRLMAEALEADLHFVDAAALLRQARAEEPPSLTRLVDIVGEPTRARLALAAQMRGGKLTLDKGEFVLTDAPPITLSGFVNLPDISLKTRLSAPFLRGREVALDGAIFAPQAALLPPQR